MTMRPYVVRQGDYLTGLADRHGFDPKQVWEDQRNAELRAERPSPEVLAPGDIVFLPEHPPREHKINEKTTNRYRAQVRMVTVVLTLREGERPLASKHFTVEGASRRIEGTSDGNGRISFQVPTTVNEVQLTLLESGNSYPVRVGHLDPADELSGVRQRLAHLGYRSEQLSNAGDPLRIAIANYQRDHGLPVTGEADQATRECMSR